MKQLFIITLSFFIHQGIFAQDGTTNSPSKWSLNQIHFSLSGSGDIINGKISDFEVPLQVDKAGHPDLDIITRTIYSEGSAFNLIFSFSPYDYENDFRKTTHNLDFGIRYSPFKELMLTYSNGSYSYLDTTYKYISYCEYYNEINALVSYKVRSQPSKFFGVFGGGEFNTGSTFGNTMMIFGSDFDTRTNSVNRSMQAIRLTLNGGITLHPINRLAIEIGGQYGIGKLIYENKPFTAKSYSIHFGLNYYMNDALALRKEKFKDFADKIKATF